MSHSILKIGDICELVLPVGVPLDIACDPVSRPYLGQEVEVIGIREELHISGMPRYEVCAKDGYHLAATPDCLRKRRPPREPVTDWASVPYANEIRRARELA